ncbi:MAG TPA: hypothetical protein VKB93_03235 [Thermoanaerobaculia bacterium]|nr:hypothetical protein [Thermoanaerobaculia bacterium]
MFVLCLAPSLFAAGSCWYEPVLEVVLVCGHYSDGTSSCHYQYEWGYGWSCDTYGGGGPLPPPPGGGGTPLPPPPPELEIESVSDYNPDQPVLNIRVANAVECTLGYNGYTAMTFAPTDHVFLDPVSAYGPSTPVTVQCRNSVNTYATAVMDITRSFGEAAGYNTVTAVWTVNSMDSEPEVLQGDWNRGLRLGYRETSYSVPTVDARNGRYEHITTEDQIASATDLVPNSDYPLVSPAFDTQYTINNPKQLNLYNGWSCDASGIVFGYRWKSVCTDVNAFVRDGSPGGTADLTEFDVPMQWVFSTSVFAGSSLYVAP